MQVPITKNACGTHASIDLLLSQCITLLVIITSNRHNS